MLYFSIITLCVLFFLISEFFLYLGIGGGLKTPFLDHFLYALFGVLVAIAVIALIITLPLFYLTDIHWFCLSVLLGYAILLSYLDIRYHYLPDFLTLSLLIFGLILNKNNLFTDFYLAVVGALVGYCFLLVIHIMYRIAFKQPGIGLGDAKLLAAIGAIVGLKSLPAVVLIACVSCLLVIFLRKKIFGIELRERIFYAPFLMAGLFVVLI